MKRRPNEIRRGKSHGALFLLLAVLSLLGLTFSATLLWENEHSDQEDDQREEKEKRQWKNPQKR